MTDAEEIDEAMYEAAREYMDGLMPPVRSIPMPFVRPGLPYFRPTFGTSAEGDQASQIYWSARVLVVPEEERVFESALKEIQAVLEVLPDALNEMIYSNALSNVGERMRDEMRESWRKKIRPSARIALWDALDVVDPEDGVDTGAMFAALSMWHIGEYLCFASDAPEEAAWHLLEAALSLGWALQVTHYMAGRKQAETATAQRISVRNARAAGIAHRANRARLKEAHTYWRSETWRVQADGIRAVSKRFAVEFKTAERWVLSWKKQAFP